MYNLLPSEGQVHIEESEYQGRKYYFIGERFNVATNYISFDTRGHFNGAFIFEPKEFPPGPTGGGAKQYDVRVTLNDDQTRHFQAYDTVLAESFESQQDGFNLPRSALGVPFLHAAEEHNGKIQLRVKARVSNAGSDKGKNDCEVVFIRTRAPLTDDDSGVEVVQFEWSDGTKHMQLEHGTTRQADHEATWARAENILRGGGKCCMQLTPNIWASAAGKGLHYKCKKMFVVDANVSSGDFDCMLPPGTRIVEPTEHDAQQDQDMAMEEGEQKEEGI
tara:strand:+ start:315 stop:1142 length:828 start_codon:yes stop_codon:yes gene_type:complete